MNLVDLDYLNQNLRVYDDKDNELSIISIESNKYDTLAFVVIIKLWKLTLNDKNGKGLQCLVINKINLI